MKSFILLFFLFGTKLFGQQPVSNLQQEIVFRDVHVVSMENDRVVAHQTVVIKNGKIEAIGEERAIRYNKKALVIDANGKYLMPGLAEMHAHVPPVDDFGQMESVLMLFAVNGITTIRGMLGHPKHLELRDMVRSDQIVGPNFYTTGPSFNGSSVSSPEQGAAMVRDQKKAGYDFLKLHPGLSRQEFDSIASAAKTAGIPFAGHVSFGVGVWHAIDAGYSSIDHLDGFIEGLVPDIGKMNEQETGLFGMFISDKADQSRIPELMKALKRKNIWVVPTQSLAERWLNPDYTAVDFVKDPDAVYINKKMKEQWISSKNNLPNNPLYDPEKVKGFVLLRRKLIRACQEHGVGLLLGCDAPQVFNVPGFSTHNELEYLVQAGLTPFQALQTGTVNVGKYLGIGDSGVIRKGAPADLVLINGNPLEDISQTRNISGVMIGDTWLPREYIDSELKKLRTSE